MISRLITQGYMIAVAIISIVSLIYVYSFPPASMLTTRDGAPHFSPRVAHPETGEPLALEELIRHYRGD